MQNYDEKKNAKKYNRLDMGQHSNSFKFKKKRVLTFDSMFFPDIFKHSCITYK